MPPTENTADDATYAGLAWISSHPAQWVLGALAVVLAALVVILALYMVSPWLVDASDRGCRWLGRVVGNGWRALAARLARPGSGGAHTRKAQLAIAATAYHPDEPVEPGEEETGADEEAAEPDPVEVYDPLTSPLAITDDAPAPLYASLPPVQRPDWGLEFTGAWLAIDTSKLSEAETAGAR